MVLAAQQEIGGMFRDEFINLQATAVNTGTDPANDNSA